MTPLGQVLALGNQTLMNGAGQQGDALAAVLAAEVLAGEADSTRTGRVQDIHIQVLHSAAWASEHEDSGG